MSAAGISVGASLIAQIHSAVLSYWLRPVLALHACQADYRFLTRCACIFNMPRCDAIAGRAPFEVVSTESTTGAGLYTVLLQEKQEILLGFMQCSIYCKDMGILIS